MKDEIRLNRLLILVALLVFLHTVIRYFFSRGMFFDGVTYAAVSQHWSEGLGSTWQPHYHNRDYPFYAHPPLLYMMLGSLFRTLGNYWWVENLYNALTFVVSISLSIALFRMVFPEYRNRFGFVLIGLAALPIWAWSFRSTMMENTVLVFSLSALCFLMLARKRSIYWIMPAGFCIGLGMFTKGPVALFPLSFFLLYDISMHLFSWRTFYHSFLLLIIPAAMLGFVWIVWRDSHSFFNQYFHQQILGSLSGTDGRLSIFRKVVLELLPLLITGVALWVLARRKGTSLPTSRILFLTLVGLSASIPLLISGKQRAFYLMPSLTFFALSWAIIASIFLQNSMLIIYKAHSKKMWFVVLMGLVLSMGWMICCLPAYNRDADIQHDVIRISEKVPHRSLIGCDSITAVHWPTVAYFARYGQFTISDVGEMEYYISRHNPPESGWKKVAIGLRYFELYQRHHDN